MSATDYFRVRESGSSVSQELLAATSTFATMAYILFVNPLILGATGIDPKACFVATALACCFSTAFLGLFTNYPFALAPGMGLNAVFTYNVVLERGHSWQEALGACFVAALFFLLINAVGFRERIMHAIPENMRVCLTGGIGLFLMLIGLENAKLITTSQKFLVHFSLSQEVVWTCLGLIVIALFQFRKLPGGILASIFILWCLSLIFGLSEWGGVMGMPPSLAPSLFQLSFQTLASLGFWQIVMDFLFTVLFDAAGTVFALATFGFFVNKEGKLPRADRIFYADGVATLFASLLGTSIMSIYLESAAGIRAGGRTGLTALFVALFFLGSLFFSPLISSIPLFASAPALLTIGAMMVYPAKHIDWHNPYLTVAGLITMLTIPLTMSVADGVSAGFIFYPLAMILSKQKKQIESDMWIISGLCVLKLLMDYAPQFLSF